MLFHLHFENENMRIRNEEYKTMRRLISGCFIQNNKSCRMMEISLLSFGHGKHVYVAQHNPIDMRAIEQEHMSPL